MAGNTNASTPIAQMRLSGVSCANYAAAHLWTSARLRGGGEPNSTTRSKALALARIEGRSEASEDRGRK